MKSEQSRVLRPAFNIKKSGAWPEMINPQHARAEKNTERRLGFNLCKLGSSPDKVVPGFRQTGAKVVLCHCLVCIYSNASAMDYMCVISKNFLLKVLNDHTSIQTSSAV